MATLNNDSVATRRADASKPLNPFARMDSKENQRENTKDGQTTIRRIIAPSQPAVVYNEDSKSAAILSTLLKTKVEKPENVARVVERRRASVVPLLGLRDRVARLVGRQEEASIVHGSSHDTIKEGGAVLQYRACETKVEKQCDDDGDVVVVEEINLVSSDEDVERCEEEHAVEEKILRNEIVGEVIHKRSTGVALFDAFTAGVDVDNTLEGGEEDGGECYDDDDDDKIIEKDREIGQRNLPNMVEIDGIMQPWWKRFPDFVPVAELENGKDPRNGEPVFVNYMSQFKGTKVAQVGSRTRKQSKKMSQSGHWVSRDGEKCFVTAQGESLSGRAAYIAYKSYSKTSVSKKSRTGKRKRKRSKKKS